MTVTDLISYIEANLENKINIDMLCQFTGYSRRYIQIIFKKHINISLWQYIKYRRITRAALLLRLTPSKIIDISFRLQFDSQQSFNREFKKIVGCTPRQYRNNENWDLTPILLPRTVDFKHPTPPEICFIEAGVVHGTEFSYEVEAIDTDKPFPIRWNLIDKNLRQGNTTIYLLSQFKIGGKSHESIRVKTVIGNTDKSKVNPGNIFSYDAGMYVRMCCTGSKEKYIEGVNKLYLITLPYYQLKRKEGYDIEIISKSKNEYKCELYIPVLV